MIKLIYDEYAGTFDFICNSLGEAEFVLTMIKNTDIIKNSSRLGYFNNRRGDFEASIWVESSIRDFQTFLEYINNFEFDVCVIYECNEPAEE